MKEKILNLLENASDHELRLIYRFIVALIA
jgi:hypothetical protein|nr:MAG TPA_asm: hypothetical protein [Caudoviricetes sp.]